MIKLTTPETDAVAAHEGNWDTKALRMTAHARNLERERDEAREVASGLAEQAKRLRKERDEAREDRDMAQRYALDSDHAYDLMVKAVDEAREELANIESLMFGGLVQFTPKDGIAWRVFYAVMELKKERDEARKEAEYYKERYEQLKDQYGR